MRNSAHNNEWEDTMDCAERQRILKMSNEEFDKLDPALIEAMDVHYCSCSACQALEARTVKALEPYFEAARAMDTEDDLRRGFADAPELAEQIIADAKEVGHTFAKDDEDGTRRLEEAAASSSRLKTLLETGEAPPPSEEKVRERIKRIQAEIESSPPSSALED